MRHLLRASLKYFSVRASVMYFLVTVEGSFKCKRKHDTGVCFLLIDLRACVEIDAAKGAWRDVNCGEYRPFICKRKMGKVNKIAVLHG